ncbi:MAG: dTDP-4-dehydrorhamnose reductase [Acidimicrobiia bacterium]|nr:dTDP-4-dehydrorhamnose reductase [Acidimicrobiia bacterium]
MTVVVTGANGLLGAVTVREWRDRGYEVVALTRAELDVTDGPRVADVIGRFSPSAVINCTAYNRVDDAEKEPSSALAVNAWAVRSLARAAAAAGAVFVHYSTDFVFDGEADRPYTEDDAPNPQSHYAMSKLIGEWMAAPAGPAAHVGPAELERANYILRVESLFGGAASRSTIDTMLQNFAAGRTVRAFRDRTVSPSHVADVARATCDLLERKAPGGIYHCVNTGMATWLEIAERLREWSGHPMATIEPVLTTDVALKARRPRFCALSNAKLLATGITMPTWQEALRWHVAS